MNRPTIADALSLAKEIIERGATIPILNNVRLTVRTENAERRLELEATDLDLEINIDLGPSSWSELDVTVPFAVFDLIDDNGIEHMATVRGSILEIETDSGANFKLNTLPASDFPHIKDFEPGIEFTLSASLLWNAFIAVSAGISTEETRYYLNGVFMHRVPASTGFMGDLLRFTATDGHRLFYVSHPLPKGAEAFEGVIIPRKTVKVLRAALGLLSDTGAAINIAIGGGRMRFTLPNGIIIISKAIDGRFPDYQRVVPAAGGPALLCNAAHLAAAVYAVSMIASERTRAVVMAFGSDGHIRATSPENGSASIAIPGKFSAELPPAIGLNAKYLVDCCRAFGDENISFSVTDPAAPVLMVSAESTLVVVQMPMRI